jgi:hypothetical protein
MRTSASILVAVIAFAGCSGSAASQAPNPGATAAPTVAPLAVGEFTSHGVTAKLDARGTGDDVAGTLTVSDTGQSATVDLECSRTAEGGLLMIGGLVTDSTFTEYFPKDHRVAVILRAGSPVQAVWWVTLPGEPPVESCRALMDDILADAGNEAIEGLEPIDGTVQLAP